MTEPLRVVMAQLNLLVGDITGNLERMVAAAVRARDELGGHVVVFPELSLTGYPPEDLLLRPELYTRVGEALARLAREVRGIDMIAGFPHQALGGYYNAAALLREGRMQAVYHKQHLPNYSVFDEKRYFTTGSGPCVVDIRGIPVAISICEDIWMAEPMLQARAAGARLMLNLNASPFHRGKLLERETVLRERVREGGMPIVYVNLVGGQDELVFDGGSLVMAADGGVRVRAPLFEEGLVPVDMAVEAHLEPANGAWSTPLEDEAAIYQALVLGVRDYVDKNGFPGVVIGLSGGIDSALTLAIAVDALGSERVEAVMMPSRYTAEMSVADARAEAEALGVEYHVIPIESLFTAFLSSLEREFAGLARDTTEENIQARCRGVILMAISNKKGKMVLTTGNKSELAVGYATLYGDMAGGFDLLKDVPKTLVFQLAEYRNRTARVIPQRVIDRPPSAELAPDQVDADSLPPYDVLDDILEQYVEQDRSAAEIIDSGHDADTVRRVVRMVDRNEYKRRQAPPGVRISRKAFGRDRRYPITSGYGRRH